MQDLRSDICELLTLKAKPRLASLEREASELRRRLLPLPTCAMAGEHTAGCRHCRRGSEPLDEVKKAKRDLQELGEVWPGLRG
eukprot:g9592.t1